MHPTRQTSRILAQLASRRLCELLHRYHETEFERKTSRLQNAGRRANKGRRRNNVSLSEYWRAVAEDQGLRARLAASGVDDSWCTRMNGLYDTMAMTSPFVDKQASLSQTDRKSARPSLSLRT